MDFTTNSEYKKRILENTEKEMTSSDYLVAFSGMAKAIALV